MNKETEAYAARVQTGAQAVAAHYGLKSQISITQEECAELIQALSKLRRVGCGDVYSVGYIEARNHVAEEMADVQNLLIQLAFLLNNEEMVRFWLEQKIDETLSEIEEEHNEP